MSIPTDMLHHDTADQPIVVGSWIVVMGSGYHIRYGLVTELISRGGFPSIKFRNCTTPYRRRTTDSVENPYVPRVHKSSTRRLEKVLVVVEAVIPVQAVKALLGTTEPEGTISDSLHFAEFGVG